MLSRLHWCGMKGGLSYTDEWDVGVWDVFVDRGGVCRCGVCFCRDEM